jgi:hypothetical protein
MSVSVSPLRPASQPGALPAHDVVCSECPGLNLAASIEQLARQWAREHESFHAKKKGR